MGGRKRGRDSRKMERESGEEGERGGHVDIVCSTCTCRQVWFYMLTSNLQGQHEVNYIPHACYTVM